MKIRFSKHDKNDKNEEQKGKFVFVDNIPEIWVAFDIEWYIKYLEFLCLTLILFIFYATFEIFDIFSKMTRFE